MPNDRITLTRGSSEEDVIREEANSFVRRYGDTRLAESSVDEFVSRVRSKSRDFYDPYHKALFFDEIYRSVDDYAQDHLQKAHGGNPAQGCGIDEASAKILFYIRQERLALPLVTRGKAGDISTRNSVFISYSRKDEAYKDMVQLHMDASRTPIDYWDDSKILPGSEWRVEIDKALNSARVGVLIISANFLASKFIQSEELPRLLDAADKDGASILYIVARHCDLDGYEEITRFQGMHALNEPLSIMAPARQDEVISNLARQVRRIMES